MIRILCVANNRRNFDLLGETSFPLVGGVTSLHGDLSPLVQFSEVFFLGAGAEPRTSISGAHFGGFEEEQ